MQTAGDYAVSAFFFFLVALFVRDTASDHFCSKSRTACTLGFSQKCSSLSDAQISRPNLIVLLRATSYVRHGLPQNHVRLCTFGFVSSRAFLVLYPNTAVKEIESWFFKFFHIVMLSLRADLFGVAISRERNDVK